MLTMIEWSGVQRSPSSQQDKDELPYPSGIQRTENVGAARSEDCHPKYVL